MRAWIQVWCYECSAVTVTASGPETEPPGWSRQPRQILLENLLTQHNPGLRWLNDRRKPLGNRCQPSPILERRAHFQPMGEASEAALQGLYAPCVSRCARSSRLRAAWRQRDGSAGTLLPSRSRRPGRDWRGRSRRGSSHGSPGRRGRFRASRAVETDVPRW